MHRKKTFDSGVCHSKVGYKNRARVCEILHKLNSLPEKHHAKGATL